MKSNKVNPILCKVPTTLWFPTTSVGGLLRSECLETLETMERGRKGPGRVTINIFKKIGLCVDNKPLLFQVKIPQLALHRKGNSLGLKKGTYRIFLTKEDISLFEYTNENRKVFYSLYSFFGKMCKEKSTVDVKREICLENLGQGAYEDVWYSLILLRDPVVEGERDIICVDSFNTPWLYQVSPKGVRNLTLEGRKLA